MIIALMLLLNMSFAAAPAEGSYTRSCYTVNDDDTLQSVVEIQQGKWTQTHTAFEEDSCKTPYLIFITEYRAKVVGSDVDLSVNEVSYTTLSDEVSRALNMVSYCGFKNWKTKEKKVVTGLLCDEFQVPQRSEILYSTFKTLTNSDQSVNLYLGAAASGEDGKSASTRFSGTEAVPYIKPQP